MQRIKEDRQKEKEQRERNGQGGDNAFFAQSKERFKKEKANKEAADAEAGLYGEDDRVESTASLFPENQSVGAPDPVSVLQISTQASLWPSERQQIETEETQWNCLAQLEQVLEKEVMWTLELPAITSRSEENEEKEKVEKDNTVQYSQVGFLDHAAALSVIRTDLPGLSGLASRYVDDVSVSEERRNAKSRERRRVNLRRALEASAGGEVINLADDTEEEEKREEPVAVAVGCGGLWREWSSVATADSLVDSFRPVSKDEVLGNHEAKADLEQWLQGWANKRDVSMRKKDRLKRKKTKTRKF